MRALRITATVLITLQAIIFLVGLSGKVPSGTPSLVASAIVWLLAVLTICAIQVGPDRQDGTYSLGMRLIRFLVWVFHILLFLLIVSSVASSGSVVMLFLALPSLLVFVVLWCNGKLTRLRKTESKKQKEEQHKEQITLPEDENLAIEELRTYYASHKEEIDAMMQTFRRVLVEKHGLREDFVMTIKHSREAVADLPISIGWHMQGTTAEEEAQKLCDVLYFSPNANNPTIFAKHMTTGEDLPPDYAYDHWMTRNFGHSMGQRMLMLGIFAALGSALYTIYTDAVFVASAAWDHLTIGISLALSLALLVQSLQRLRLGDIRTQPGRRKLKKWDLFWLVPFCCLFCWFMIGGGIGATVTNVFGTPYEAMYDYKKMSGKNCVLVKQGFPALSRFCLSPKPYQTLPTEGQASFAGKKTWLGMVLVKISIKE